MNKTSELTSKVTSKVALQDDLQDNLQDSFRTEVAHHAGVGTKRLCAAADPTALRASPATVPGFTPSHPTFMGRVPTQVCYSPFPPSSIWDAFPPKFHHGKTMEKSTGKTNPNDQKIDENPQKITTN